MKLSSSEKILGLGVSRGLGRAVMLSPALLQVKPRLLLASRKAVLLEQLAQNLELHQVVVQMAATDLTKQEDLERILTWIENEKPTRIWYFAGGGPHGPFSAKSWESHMWAHRLNFLSPARLLHELLMKAPTQLKQVLFVGSGIAEDKPDLDAASYAASKHALKGLVSSVQLEKPPFDLRLASPGYMETDLLPLNAWPREKGLARPPSTVAAELIDWLENQDDANGHRHF